MKFVFLFAVAFTYVPSVYAQAQVNPMDRCAAQRESLRKLRGKATDRCAEALALSVNCCADGNGLGCETTQNVTVSPGMRGAASTNLAGEEALRRGLTGNRENCYKYRDRIAKPDCKNSQNPDDKKAYENYSKATGLLVDCLDEEFQTSMTRSGIESVSQTSSSARPISSEEIIKALKPKR